MSGKEAPDWSDVPPADGPDQGGRAAPRGGGGGGGKGGYAPREPAPEFDQREEAEKFYAWLAEPSTRTDLKLVLPDTIDLDVFIATAKSAVFNDPKLLQPALRPSLLAAVSKAAAQGLKPDGREGALVPRWDEKAREIRVAWQPMVWGLLKLGRQTGAIQNIRAHLVFEGEDFEILAGEDDKIIHKVDLAIREIAYRAPDTASFLAHIKAAYCIITPTVGEPTKRFMPRGRLAQLYAATKASRGPWNGPFRDEMFIKAMILFTLKWVDLSGDAAAIGRFRAALETDLTLDFGEDAAPRGRGRAQAALPAPDVNLHNMEVKLGLHPERETVLAGEGATSQTPVAASTQVAAGVPPPPAATAHNHETTLVSAGVQAARRVDLEPTTTVQAGAGTTLHPASAGHDPEPATVELGRTTHAPAGTAAGGDAAPPAAADDDPIPDAPKGPRTWALKQSVAFAAVVDAPSYFKLVDDPKFRTDNDALREQFPDLAAWLARRISRAYGRVMKPDGEGA
jgi:recombination protein RecT